MINRTAVTTVKQWFAKRTIRYSRPSTCRYLVQTVSVDCPKEGLFVAPKNTNVILKNQKVVFLDQRQLIAPATQGQHKFPMVGAVKTRRARLGLVKIKCAVFGRQVTKILSCIAYQDYCRIRISATKRFKRFFTCQRLPVAPEKSTDVHLYNKRLKTSTTNDQIIIRDIFVICKIVKGTRKIQRLSN